MPAGLLPNEGLADQLEYILKRSISGVLPWELMFWVNDIEVGPATVLADLVEASWEGYVRLTMDRSMWTPPTVSAGCAHSTWGEEAVEWFVLGGPIETLYGLAYVDASMGVLRFVQRFDEDDIREIEIGGKVLVLPEYTLTSAECA